MNTSKCEIPIEAVLVQNLSSIINVRYTGALLHLFQFSPVLQSQYISFPEVLTARVTSLLEPVCHNGYILELVWLELGESATRVHFHSVRSFFDFWPPGVAEDLEHVRMLCSVYIVSRFLFYDAKFINLCIFNMFRFTVLLEALKDFTKSICGKVDQRLWYNSHSTILASIQKYTTEVNI